MVVFEDSEQKLSLLEIENFEKQHDLVFPQDYKEHLLSHNGGRCTPNIFIFTEQGKKSRSRVDWFLAIYEGEYDNFGKYLEIYKENNKRMPTHIFPIAHDPFGNLICISNGKKDFGYIYFWNHECEIDYNVEKEDEYSNLYLIAPSFVEFINNLVVDDEDI